MLIAIKYGSPNRGIHASVEIIERRVPWFFNSFVYPIYELNVLFLSSIKINNYWELFPCLGSILFCFTSNEWRKNGIEKHINLTAIRFQKDYKLYKLLEINILKSSHKNLPISSRQARSSPRPGRCRQKGLRTRFLHT